LKILLLADTHLGVRNDSLVFDAHIREFFTQTFFPYLDAHGIKTVVHLGDVFDRRKYINFQTLKSCRTYFFEPLRDRDVDMLVLPGNHDTYFKNTNDLNSLDLLLREYANIQIVDEPTDWIPDGREQDAILLVPWICPENEAECARAIVTSMSKSCFGHFGINGFEMYRGVAADHGMEANAFASYDRVFSGHFHHKSTAGNIHYLGSPYQMTWSDFGDPRGFHVYETTTGELEFIPNPKVMFNKVFYDDTREQTLVADAPKYAGTYVKLVVVNKTDFYQFDRVVDALYRAGVQELKIVEEFGDIDTEGLGEDTLDVEDTLTLLSEYVDTVEGDVDRTRLKNVLKTLYVEAQGGEMR
jgi:DNA repair exonuclease SbcCD nuclease subunit